MIFQHAVAGQAHGMVAGRHVHKAQAMQVCVGGREGVV